MNYHLFLCSYAKFGEDRTIRSRVIAYFWFTKWRPPAILDFIFLKYLSKIQICAYFYVHVQNLVKIGQSTAELLHIFDLQNGGRPPSWIWHNVISDHPRLVFDGPNILLKLRVDRVYTLQDRRFSYSAHLAWNCLFTPLLGTYWGLLPQMNSDIVATPKRTVLGQNHVVWAINSESSSSSGS